jgi:N4-gp56 family major capsid protein
MSRTYNDPGNVEGAGVVASGVGSQIRIDSYNKKALIEMRKEQYFGQLANTVSMPKNMGKTMRKYHYLPMLDDANINDQGLDADGAVIADGNLYGSSKDVGTIAGKLPVLSETGGRVNRVGFKRVEIEGTIAKFGFFDEYSQESIDFDSDADLQMHINREMLSGANEITEDALQIDLLNSPGVVKFGGSATDDIEIDDTSEIDYTDLLRLSIDLDNNRTPKQTKVITGTRLVDTKTLPGGRVMYIGSELQLMIEGMVDLHGVAAFTSVEKYAAGGTVLNGEIGTVGKFRIVVVPEMMKWEGAGADNTGNTTHFATGTNYDVFPMLVVGDASFSTIGFQTDGKTVKFKIKHAAPGSSESYAIDPYGETGFMSIKWYYGFLLERGERIAVAKTSAPM